MGGMGGTGTTPEQPGATCPRNQLDRGEESFCELHSPGCSETQHMLVQSKHCTQPGEGSIFHNSKFCQRSHLLTVKLTNIPTNAHMISSNSSCEEVRDELRIAGVAAELLLAVDDDGEADHPAHRLDFSDLGKNPVLAGLEPLCSFHWTAQVLHLMKMDWLKGTVL